MTARGPDSPMPPSPFTFEQYRWTLGIGLENGYKFISFPDLERYRGTDQAVCLLRHDCDNDLTAAATMARVEEEMGVQSTYLLMGRSPMYNLLSGPSVALVREIVSRGHWLGLHFDEHYYPEAGAEQIAAYVEQERSWLSQELRVPLEVVSFHQPSSRVLDGEIKLSCINAYDTAYTTGVHYLSDSNFVWNDTPLHQQFRTREHTQLQALVHPECWTQDEVGIEQKWDQILRNNVELMQESLLTRESSYNQRRGIEFS